MDKQRKIRKDIGLDTFVRGVEQDRFSRQSTQSYEVLPGEILITQPEPFFRQTAVTVQLSRGGVITGVPYPNAAIDPITGNLHGTYEGPYPGQMVAVGFLNGNSSAPYIVNRYPYQGVGNTLTELQHILPMSRNLYDSTDVIIGHFTGSALRFNTGLLSGKLPGSVSLDAVTQLELDGFLTSVSGSTSLSLSSLLGSVDISAATTAALAGNVSVTVSSPLTATVEGDLSLALIGGTISLADPLGLNDFGTLTQLLFIQLIATAGAIVPQNPATAAIISALTALSVKYAVLFPPAV